MYPKGIFFDLYGTLLIYGNMREAWSKWLNSLYDSFCRIGLKISKESLAQKCENFCGRSEISTQTNEGLTLFERQIQALCNDLGLYPSKNILQKTANLAVQAWQQYVSLDPEATQVLTELKSNKVLALISNFNHPPHIHSLLSELGIKSFFRTIIISGEVGVKKPDPTIFYMALDRTGLQPEQVVYVGDSETDDAEGAYSAGIQPIIIQRQRQDKNLLLLDFKADTNHPQDPIEVVVIPENVKVISKLSSLMELFV